MAVHFLEVDMRNVYLVYGAPCSGKTTYVLNHAGPSDIVIDIDRICQAISVNKLYDKPEQIVSAAMAVRNMLIQFIEEDKSIYDAYIIGGFPQRKPRHSLVSRTHAHSIFIDTDFDTCMARAGTRAIGYDKVVAKWFDEFESDNEHEIPWVDEFYHSIEWRKIRTKVLEIDHNECQICKSRGTYTKANTVHHVNHITDKPELRLSIFVPGTGERNLISVCSSCHNELHPEKGYRIRTKANEERW